MIAKAAALAALFAVAYARFGQEQLPIQAISSVNGGESGVAPTIAGAAISDLLAATNACDKLKRGDEILAKLGTGADAVAAAIGMVAAEKNFNPFVQDIPTICSDPTLPTSLVLRGITPLIDPAVDGADAANALSAQTVATPLSAEGKSVADLLAENGFTSFTTQDAAGTKGAAPVAGDAAGGAVAGGAGGDAAAAVVDVTPAAGAANATVTQVAAADSCAAAVSSALAAATGAAAAGDAASGDAAAGDAAAGDAAAGDAAAGDAAAGDAAAGDAAAGDAAAGDAAAGGSGADFGLCTPTIKFEGGLGGRPATEFTFQLIDPLMATGQQEALNPNIITNRACDQLTNVCEANAEAVTVCLDAKAQIAALGTRDKTTADTWNTLLGFDGAVTNPSGGPASPPAKMRVVRRSMVGYHDAE